MSATAPVHRTWLDQELERVVRRRVVPREASRADTPNGGRPLTAAAAREPAVTLSAPYNFTSANTPGVSYNGPALTDADIRRIERGEE